MNIKPNVNVYAFCMYMLCIFSGCTRSQASSLFLHIENESAASIPFKLKALTETARSAVIDNPDRAPYMFFSFDDTAISKQQGVHSLIASGGYALELDIESPLPRGGTASGQTAGRNDGQSAVKEGFFFFGFIYEDDIVSNPIHSSAKHTKRIEERTGIKGTVRQGAHFKAVLGFKSAENVQEPADIRGFMIYSEVPISLKGAKITKARYGRGRSGGLPWFGFSAAGGNIVPGTHSGESASQPVVFRSLPPRAEGERRELHISFRSADSVQLKSAEENGIELLCGGEKLSIYRHKSMRSAVVDMRAFNADFDTVKINAGASFLDAIVITNEKESAFSPITADPGLIIDWPQANWRNRQFELFSWQQFPSVLIFDCTDYRVQDAFFKRLAFYVEKKGFAGRLLSDEDIAGMHGFNAHDYRAESLASFFNDAEQLNFRLNKDELLLRDILFANGVLVRRADGIAPGRGAVISISRESPHYLRQLFITHEGLHGIYFTEQSFRSCVDTVFYTLEKSDPKALAFLRRYFEVTPSLNYNTADGYLLKNEFMAYLLQQRPSEVKHYLTEVLSKRRYISAAEPELCEYIRKTQARSLTEAAEVLSDFLYENWGLAGGSVFSVKID